MSQVLRPLTTQPAWSHADLLVGTDTSDDAGVFRLDEDKALVQTVDFFAPVVDEAFDWGRITAANALSDVYAMGGQPLTALQLVGWPRSKLPFSLLREAMSGGAVAMAEAGATITGGHSIDSEVPLYGFAVTGTVDPSRVITNQAAQPGDAMVLTKPLGTGVIAAGLKAGVVEPAVRDLAVASMSALNGAASRVMIKNGVRCATDVTGFGLIGHLREIMAGSGVSSRVEMDRVPVLEGVVDLIRSGVYPGGSLRNLESAESSIKTRRARTDLQVLADAQTSGGLLMAVPPPHLDQMMSELVQEVPAAAVIGEFTTAASEPGIEVI